MSFVTYDVEYMRRRLKSDRPGFVAAAERQFRSKISLLAQQIALDKGSHPVILLCGPSGSGKTTTAAYLAQALVNMGHSTKILSLDEYFLPKETPNLPRTADGEIDYETPERLDIPLLVEHLEKIFACEPVSVPHFDFPTQSRLPGQFFHRQEGEFVIVEGIHALNPNVMGIAMEFSRHIYVSVRTRLQLPNGDLLHPSMIRLMRRLLRDERERGRCFADTMDLLKNVTAGEEDYIIPYKRFADWDVDTFMPYEAALFSSYLTEKTLPMKKPYDKISNEILPFLSQLPPVFKEEIPANSLLREFVGNND